MVYKYTPDTECAYLNTEYVQLLPFPLLYNKFICKIKIIGAMNDHAHFSPYTSLAPDFTPQSRSWRQETIGTISCILIQWQWLRITAFEKLL